MNLKRFVVLAWVVGGLTVSGCANQRISPCFNTVPAVSSRSLRSQAFAVRFSSDGKFLMVAGSTGSGTLSSDVNSEQTLSFNNHDKRLRLWNVAKRREMAPLAAQPIFGGWNGYHMLLKPDFKTLVTSWGAWEIKDIDVHKRRPDKVINVRNGYISSMAVSPDGKILALGMTSEVQFRDARTFRLLKTYTHGGQGTG